MRTTSDTRVRIMSEMRNIYGLFLWHSRVASMRPVRKHSGVPSYAAGGATLACTLFFGIPARRRSWQTMLGMLMLLITLAGSVFACGGGGGSTGGGGGGGGMSNPGTTAGTYTVTVTGTSGATTATGTVTLTVQ